MDDGETSAGRPSSFGQISRPDAANIGDGYVPLEATDVVLESSIDALCQAPVGIDQPDDELVGVQFVSSPVSRNGIGMIILFFNSWEARCPLDDANYLPFVRSRLGCIVYELT